MSTWKITAAISAAYCYFAYFLHEPFLNMYKHSFRESWLYILDSHELTETMIQITLLLTPYIIGNNKKQREYRESTMI